ncbi:hypothetical protein GUJ93_ZPchr0004g38558 [Zizania palustris]|uniref:Uncharacterized protein n=1 Tax=Zizania palustris TaxID=103762 RepID=A0A8J5VZ21_ZIZPA|nr:hypothetical protein GUJ93_ZPchr0004g38558 [Zizania palustris]
MENVPTVGPAQELCCYWLKTNLTALLLDKNSFACSTETCRLFPPACCSRTTICGEDACACWLLLPIAVAWPARRSGNQGRKLCTISLSQALPIRKEDYNDGKTSVQM